MVAQLQPGQIWTVDQYHLLERQGTVKHEYHDGYVYAMAGGTVAHNQIAGNIYSLLRVTVRGGPCRAQTSDMMIRQTEQDFVYADAVVTCEPRDTIPTKLWIEHPTLVVEVLSPSTERYDRGVKFEGYKKIPTLREYVLVSSQTRAIELWQPDADGEWASRLIGSGDIAISLASIGLTMTLEQVYEDSGI